jgi:DNA-binding response OmpR family regulator
LPEYRRERGLHSVWVMSGDVALAPLMPDPIGGAVPTIMLVEDELALRRLIAKTLTLSGYNVVSTATVGECLEYFQRAHGVGDVATPALLLSDVHLPDGTGLQIAQRIRPVWHGPVVLLTALCSGAVLARAQALGHEILEKPFDIAHLSSRVEAYVPHVSTRRRSGTNQP